MNLYRIYMSVRREDTGAQVADITIIDNVLDAGQVERCIEMLTKGDMTFAGQRDLKDAVRSVFPEISTQFVYMKQLHLACTVH